MLAAAVTASSVSAAASAQASDEDDVILLEGAAVYQVISIFVSFGLSSKDGFYFSGGIYNC